MDPARGAREKGQQPKQYNQAQPAAHEWQPDEAAGPYHPSQTSWASPPWLEVWLAQRSAGNLSSALCGGLPHRSLPRCFGLSRCLCCPLCCSLPLQLLCCRPRCLSLLCCSLLRCLGLSCFLTPPSCVVLLAVSLGLEDLLMTRRVFLRCLLAQSLGVSQSLRRSAGWVLAMNSSKAARASW